MPTAKVRSSHSPFLYSLLNEKARESTFKYTSHFFTSMHERGGAQLPYRHTFNPFSAAGAMYGAATSLCTQRHVAFIFSDDF